MTEKSVPVSVIIPAYNHTEQAQQAIESVFAQTQHPAEIIVVDDASDAPISHMITGIAPHAPDSVNIITRRHDSNRGAAAARNTGIAEASSDFLAFLDADDTWMPDKLSQQLPSLQHAVSRSNHPVASATGFDLRGSYAITRQPERLGLVPRPATTLREFASGCWFCPGSTLMVHKSFFDVVGLYDDTLRRFEDYELFLRAGQNTSQLDVVPQTLATINSTPSLNEPPPQPSIQAILNRHGSELRSKHPSAFHRMKAYLTLESAATHYRQKRHMASAIDILKSQWHHPRLSLHVVQRWQNKAPIQNNAREHGKSL